MRPRYYWETNPLTNLCELKRVMPDLTIEIVRSMEDPEECQILVDHIEASQLGLFIGPEGAS